MRHSIRLLTLLSLFLLWGTPVRADTLPARTGPVQQNACAEQVFRDVTLITTDGGATYTPVNSFGAWALRTVYACPITSPVALGTYQPIGFRAAQTAIIVWSSPDGRWYYVHREWRVFALPAARWQQIVQMVSVKVAH